MARHLTAAALLLVATAGAQQPSADSASSRYEMRVELDPAPHTLRGEQRIEWTNDTSQPVTELRFHLYLNAFRDLESTFMREAGAAFRGPWRPDEFGWTKLDRIALAAAGGDFDLTAAARFVQPDDDNEHDATVLAVPLPKPVAAGARIALQTAFTARLPKAYRRTGWVPGEGYFCMQWFPKLGVLEERGGRPRWNCHQFHADTEFFADFSSYDVVITLPLRFQVGATGTPDPARTEVPLAGRPDFKRLAFRVDRVHDFAWVADPDFVEHRDTFGPVAAASDPTAAAVAAELGVDVATFDLPRTEIRLLLRAEHDTPEQASRHLRAAKCALRFFGLRFGPYPYPMITLVDPAADVTGHRMGGGMEYPTLIACGTRLFLHPRQQRPEGVVVHEFGHQYWYGLSANNEFEESWLDEGLNSYSEGRALWLEYATTLHPVRTTSFGLLTLAGTPGPLDRRPPGSALAAVVRDLLPARARAWLGSHRLSGDPLPPSPLLDLLREQPTATFAREAAFSDLWNDRAGWLYVDNPDAMVRPGWEYLNHSCYRANSYYRPATLLRTLERVVGRTRWWAFLRRFHTQARFHHPTTADFTALLAETCGDRAASYFAAATRAGAHLDYGIESVEPRAGRGPTKTVVVRRLGTITADLRVRFRFEGRAQPVYRAIAADDLEPHWRFRFDDRAGQRPWGRLLEVWIDPPEPGQDFENPAWPAGAHLLDENLLDNAWRAEPEPGPGLYRAVRLLLQAQAQLSFAALMG